MIDWSKLTPAPWEADDTHLVHGRGEWPDGKQKTLRETAGFGKFDSKEDAEFAALARNAFDVMMRRGWGVEKVEFSGGCAWFVMLPRSNGWAVLHGKPFADPFTALVEADRWYKEHMEKSDA